MDVKDILRALADVAGKLKDGTVDEGDLDVVMDPLRNAIADQVLPYIDEPAEQAKLAKAEGLLRLIADFI